MAHAYGVLIHTHSCLVVIWGSCPIESFIGTVLLTAIFAGAAVAYRAIKRKLTNRQ